MLSTVPLRPGVDKVAKMASFVILFDSTLRLETLE